MKIEINEKELIEDGIDGNKLRVAKIIYLDENHCVNIRRVNQESSIDEIILPLLDVFFKEELENTLEARRKFFEILRELLQSYLIPEDNKAKAKKK